MLPASPQSNQPSGQAPISPPPPIAPPPVAPPVAPPQPAAVPPPPPLPNMAMTPPRPTPPSPSAPTVPAPSSMDAQDDMNESMIESADELDLLSPSKVLNKHKSEYVSSSPLVGGVGPAAEDVPDEVSSEVKNEINNETSNEAKTKPFILPSRPIIEKKEETPLVSSTRVMPAPPPPLPVSNYGSVPTAPSISPLTAPPSAPSPIAPPAPVPLNGSVNSGLKTNIPPAPPINNAPINPINPKVKSPDGLIPKGPKKPKNVGLISIVGLLVAILILVVSGYGLAQVGVRVPLMFEKITGVSADGKSAAGAAKTKIESYKKYQFNGNISVALQADGGKTADPSADGKSDYVKYEATYLTAMAESADGSLTYRADLKVDDESAVPIVATTKTEGGFRIKSYLAANLSDNLVSIEASELVDSIISPVLIPLSLTDVLDAVKSEVAYEKQTDSSGNVAAYTYSLDDTFLAKWLPSGAEIVAGSGSAVIYYRWNGGIPTKATISIPMNYAGAKYLISMSMNYGDFDLDFKDSNKALVNPVLTSSGEAMGVDYQEYLIKLGLDPDRVIATGDLDSDSQSNGGSQDQSASPSPSASVASSPSLSPSALASPTVSPTASASTSITPTGKTTSSVLSSSAVDPIVPTQPASSEAKTRDLQRNSDLDDIQKALVAYKNSVGSYPIAISQVRLASDLQIFNLLVPKYLSAMPIDPLDNSYYYGYESDGYSFTITAIAEDGSNPDAHQGSKYYYYKISN